MKDYEYETRNMCHDIRATTDRMVEMMEKTNILWKEFAEELKKFNEVRKKDEKI